MTDVPLPRVAVLDDYQGVALTIADWSPLDGRVTIDVFRDHTNDEDELDDVVFDTTSIEFSFFGLEVYLLFSSVRASREISSHLPRTISKLLAGRCPGILRR